MRVPPLFACIQWKELENDKIAWPKEWTTEIAIDDENMKNIVRVKIELSTEPTKSEEVQEN